LGYRIVYGKKKKRFCRPSKGRKLLAAAIIICILLVIAGFLGGTELLLPGNREISGAALENLVKTVQDGASLSDAIAAFCQEIIANAQMPN